MTRAVSPLARRGARSSRLRRKPKPAPGRGDAGRGRAAQPAAPARSEPKSPQKPGVGLLAPSASATRSAASSPSSRGKGGELATRCATPLGRFELEQLKLVAVVTGLENPVAMVQAPNGVGYSLRRGACIGKNGGTVAAVRTGEVVVAEWAVRADGTRDRTQTVIRLPREAALNLEE